MSDQLDFIDTIEYPVSDPVSVEPPFQTIVIDPPWMESGGGQIQRGADRHYPLLKTPEIIDVILSCPMWKPAENSRLYLWVTNNFLIDGLEVMKSLDFRYITNLVWVKDRIGLGQYFRGQHELVLFGVRGKTMGDTKPSTVIHAKRGKHSKKPTEFFNMVESCSRPSRLEIFAREPRSGWAVWGNEI